MSNMTRTIHFTKMQGAGNDYIYVNTLLYNIPDPEKRRHSMEQAAFWNRKRRSGAHLQAHKHESQLQNAHLQCRRLRGHDVRKRIKMHREVSL